MTGHQNTNIWVNEEEKDFIYHISSVCHSVLKSDVCAVHYLRRKFVYKKINLAFVYRKIQRFSPRHENIVSGTDPIIRKKLIPRSCFLFQLMTVRPMTSHNTKRWQHMTMTISLFGRLVPITDVGRLGVIKHKIHK